MNDPRGSIWRKWDLHIHTPESYENEFGNDWYKYIDVLKEKAIEHNIEVAIINDYFTINGYEKIVEEFCSEKYPYPSLRLKNDRNLFLLPGIELRLSIFDHDEDAVNLHIVFDPRLLPGNIRSEFIEKLSIKFLDKKLNCREDDLIKIGYAVENGKNYDVNLDIGKFNEEQKKHFLKKGYQRITLDLDDIDDGLRRLNENLTNFSNERTYLKLMAYKGHGSLAGFNWYNIYRQEGRAGNTKCTLLNNTDICFTNNKGDRDFLLGLDTKTPPEEILSRFRTFKPVVWGSDSKSLNNLFHPSNGATTDYTWIKADPTFGGLLQLLNEPKDRVFIGTMPESLEMKNEQPTKILDFVKIQKVVGSTINEDWFNQELPLNPDLVAIIGNKGSGKSALAEVLGLLGNTPRYESFSFLHGTRFRKLPENKAKDFEGSILWRDKSSMGPLSLDKNPQLGQQEKIKYIPQDYIEEICNEINIGEGSKFYDEIQDVIFSHVPIPDRMGYSSLKELLKYRSEETRKAIENLILELRELNTKIIDSEERLSAQHRQWLESKLEEKKRELDAHDSPTVKPKEVKPPQENPEVIEISKTISPQLEIKLETLKKIEDDIQNEIFKDKRLVIQYTTADKILTRYQNIDRQLKKDLEETKADLTGLGINQSDVFSYKLNLKILENKKLEIQSRRDEIKNKLNEKFEGSLAQAKKVIDSEIRELQSKLSEPQQKFQQYQKLLKEWREKRTTILNAKEEIDKRLLKLKEEPKILVDLIQKREDKTLEIFKEKEKLKGYYVSYYSGVHKFLQEDPIAKGEEFKLTFNVSILEKGFEKGFFILINQRVVGPFMGIKEGSIELNKLLSSTNFDSAEDVIKFTKELLKRMEEYDGKRMNIADQLVGKKNTLKELYDYIFSLQYLEPNYNLKWEKKDLSQLSPGEKGNLLLIFYLLVDRDNIPLVIDQPEANLDNNTVFKTLVPCIKDTKKRRQIIIVTHNPNLAVVCDAEQIIHAHIDKEHGNKVIYTSGSIENPVINKYIVDVLEGTQPAFDNRDSKYMRINY